MICAIKWHPRGEKPPCSWGLVPPPAYQAQYKAISGALGSNSNLERVLDRVRLIAELLEGGSGDYLGLDQKSARLLDTAVCGAIHDNVATPPIDKLFSHKSLAKWLRHVRRDSPVEIFTTNYDLLLEVAFEAVGMPYFDGFVGSVLPFFVPESIDAEPNGITADVYPPASWIRLWKLHGSVGWQLVADPTSDTDKICRILGKSATAADQLLIYPAREKYVQSRRLPFVVYQAPDTVGGVSPACYGVFLSRRAYQRDTVSGIAVQPSFGHYGRSLRDS
jgi:hypothetical protein